MYALPFDFTKAGLVTWLGDWPEPKPAMAVEEREHMGKIAFVLQLSDALDTDEGNWLAPKGREIVIEDSATGRSAVVQIGSEAGAKTAELLAERGLSLRASVVNRHKDGRPSPPGAPLTWVVGSRVALPVPAGAGPVVHSERLVSDPAESGAAELFA